MRKAAISFGNTTLLDAIVVGSGPGGTLAAHGLAGKKVLVLDVGHRPPPVPHLNDNLFDMRQREADLFDLLIGREFQSLHNLHLPNISMKLKSPLMSYIAEGSSELCPIRPSEFEATLSFAQGGFANAWGAGVYRFNDRELAPYPIDTAELAPYYQEVTDHIGISGGDDDLSRYFGSTEGLLPPMRKSKLAKDLLSAYEAKRTYFQCQGISFGHPRLAVLTEPHRNRPAYRYQSMEFFRPWDPAVYNPAYTLNELIDAGDIEYASRRLVVHFAEEQSHVVVEARNLDSGERETYRAKHLLLGAGAIGSAKLALQSNQDHKTRLPIQDNPMSVIPLIRPDYIGAALDVDDSSFAQLNMVYAPDGQEPMQASLYGATGPLRSDVLFEMPLAISANLSAVRALSPALVTLMLFYPGRASPGNQLRLCESGELEIHCDKPQRGEAERGLIRHLRKLGLYGLRALCQYPNIGAGLHYAATLPMKRDPGPYETDAFGRLFGTRNVFVVDGASLTDLPAKNHTFTIMANALRIGRYVAGQLG